MRNITSVIIKAFLNKVAKSQDNSSTDGTALFLHGNKIAEWRNGELWICDGGYTDPRTGCGSKTTKERLNALPGVSIAQKARHWFLNGKEWDGQWVKVG